VVESNIFGLDLYNQTPLLRLDEIRVSLCFIVFSYYVYWVVYFLCVVWFCYYVSQVIGREDLFSWYLSCWRVSPDKDQIEELFTVMVYFMYCQHLTLSTYSLILLFYCNIFVKCMI